MSENSADRSISIRSEFICEVTSIERVTDSIVEITLAPRDSDPLDFLPGQYVLLNDTEYRLTPRSYSVANAPRPDGKLTLLITRVEGGRLSTWAHDELKPHDAVSLEGPYGTFTADTGRSEPVLYLAAGSGLAPIRALLDARLSADSIAGPTSLIFSARTEADVLDRAHFAMLSAAHPEFRFIRTLTRGPGPEPRGRVPDLLSGLCADLTGHDVFIAGAPGFVAGCSDAAEAAGADRARIRTEVFFVDP
ncbi:MAG: ferredoxin [Thermoleophilia bacterium]|nr:ferredoxin [Thermoleophilia bacterium]